MPLPCPLATNAQLGDERSITLDVVTSEVVEHPTAAADEHRAASLGVKVLLVDLHVLRQVADALGEECDLHFGEPVSESCSLCSLIVAALSGMRA